MGLTNLTSIDLAYAITLRQFWASLVLGIVDRPGDQDGRDQILAGARPAGR